MSVNKFWEIDDFMLHNEKISCFASTETNLKFLSGGSNNSSSVLNETLKEGDKVELPLWFAEVLADSGYFAIKPPKFLTEKYYYYLQTDPRIADLRAKSLYFYDICLNLIQYIDDEQKWPRCLAKVLYQRFLYLLQNSNNEKYENQSILKVLCWKEKYFYDRMVKVDKNIKFYLDNYANNNKSLDELIETKKIAQKRKKVS